MDKDKNIVNSRVDATAKIYSNVLIKNSTIGKKCIIGNDSVIIDSSISDFVSLNRRNDIRGSQIGTLTYTGTNCKIKHSIVGNFCSISWNISIGGNNHNYTRVTMHQKGILERALDGKEINLEKPVDKCVIHNDVWIAANAVVLRNIEIGNGAIIGAGAVVTKDVEPYSIVVGNPARVIKKRFEEDIIIVLERLQWWNWPLEVINKYKELIYSQKVDKITLEKLMKIKDNLGY